MMALRHKYHGFSTATGIYPRKMMEINHPPQNPILLRIDPTTFVGSLADVVFVVVSKDDAGGHLENVRRPAPQPLTDFTLEQASWVLLAPLLANLHSDHKSNHS